MYSQNTNGNMSTPAVIRCQIDGKMEPKDAFSKNQLKKYSAAIRRGVKIPVSCRKHTPSPVEELQCEGCLQTKALEHFSKSARKHQNSTRCRDCTEWSESDLPGIDPVPAPNAIRSIEETTLYGRKHGTAQDFSEYGENDEDGNALSTAVSKLSFQGSYDGLTANALNNGWDKTSGSFGRGAQSVRSYNPSSAPSNWTSSAAAHGPNGTVQNRNRSTVNVSESASLVSGTGTRFSRTGFAKLDQRKTAPALPNYIEYEDPKGVHYDWDSDGSEDHC